VIHAAMTFGFAWGSESELTENSRRKPRPSGRG
jgi:hypothetical protein